MRRVDPGWIEMPSRFTLPWLVFLWKKIKQSS